MTDSIPPSAPISRSSLYVAAGRAIGAREPDPAARNPDDLVERLLGDPASLGIDHPAVQALSKSYDEAMSEMEVVNVVRMMMIRTRFIDDALQRAIAGGATQMLVLGAGFDTHAYRFRDQLTHVRVFEVDRPATQAFKRQRVCDVLGEPPVNLTYVPIDFQHENLAEVLARHGYDREQRTFFILEGVTMYLSAEAVSHTLRFVGSHPPGSTIALDFVYEPMVAMLAQLDITRVPAASRPYVQRFLDVFKDEPWTFGIPVHKEREFLAEYGLELRDALMIGGEESLKRYVTKADGTQVGAQTIATAMMRIRDQIQASGDAEMQARMSPERMQEQQRLMAYHIAEAVVS